MRHLVCGTARDLLNKMGRVVGNESWGKITRVELMSFPSTF